MEFHLLSPCKKSIKSRSKAFFTGPDNEAIQSSSPLLLKFFSSSHDSIERFGGATSDTLQGQNVRKLTETKSQYNSILLDLSGISLNFDRN